MITVRFLGRVIPPIYKITVEPPTHIPAFMPNFGANSSADIAVKDSVITVTCLLERFERQSDLTVVYHSALSYTSALVDLVAFNIGRGLTVVLEQFIEMNGTKTQIEFFQSRLATLCTAFSLGGPSFADAFQLAISDPMIYRALRDLIDGITTAQLGPINFARAIDGLRKSMTPREEDRKKSWNVFNANLQLDKSYVASISKHSLEPRHGNPQPLSIGEFTELSAKAWIITNRYISFRRRGGQQPLPLVEFPLLTLQPDIDH